MKLLAGPSIFFLCLFSILIATHPYTRIFGLLDLLTAVALAVLAMVYRRRGTSIEFDQYVWIIPVFLYSVVWLVDCLSRDAGMEVIGTGINGLRFSIFAALFITIRQRFQISPSALVVSLSLVLFAIFLELSPFNGLTDAFSNFSGTELYTSRRLGVNEGFNTATALALMIASILPLVLPNRLTQPWHFLATLLVMIFVIASFSRGALIIAFLASALTTFAVFRLGIKSILLVLALLAICVGTLSTLGYFDIRSFEFGSDSSASLRVRAIQLVGEMTIVGDKDALNSFNITDGAIDNFVVRHVVGAGALSLIFGYMLLLYVIKVLGNWHNYTDMQKRIIVAQIAWVFTIILDDTFFSVWGAFLFSLSPIDVRPKPNAIRRRGQRAGRHFGPERRRF